jgi:hypothetical protein
MAVQSYTKQSAPYVASLSLGSDADIVSGNYQVFISLFHDWTDTIVDNVRATRDSAGEYIYEFSADNMASFGNHKIVWRYIKSSVTSTFTQYINVYSQYISSGEFFDIYPELETTYGDKFDSTERRVRSVIDTVCGQNFQSIKNKTLSFEGEDRETIYFGIRCTSLIEATQKPDVDITGDCEITVESKAYVRRIEQLIPIATSEKMYLQPRFSENEFYLFRGNWGWDYVPTNVTDAAALLIYDYLNDDNAYAKHGISQMKMDQYSLTFGTNAMAGTGNIEVDVLLMDYTLYTMGMI